jgi:glutamate-ammonia-ligase adenylyltransferase
VKELGDALDRAPDLAGKLDAMRRFKHVEEIRIGIADLLSNMPLTAVSRDLSKLAEVCLDAALSLAASEIARRCGAQGSTAGLAVIGAGKLGGRELTYGSDLDIFFVYSERLAEAPPAGLTVFEYFSKIAEKTISYLSTLTREGFVFRVDTRLRPTGSKGPLAQSIDAFKSYYDGRAETWELQAMVRARRVAGDRVAGQKFASAIQRLIYRDQDRVSLANDVMSMRKRMENEVGRESALVYNIKQGAGGLVDLEFPVQYLQLLHGMRYPRVRVPGTLNALRALKREGLLDGDTYQNLARAYLFMRQLESRMRIVSNQATSELSRDPEKLQLLALRMGYLDEGESAGRKLLHDYESVSRRVKQLFDDILLKC